MKEKVVLSESKKKDAYNQIYKNFWNIIYYSGVIGQGEMDMLKNLLVSYFGIKYDFAVPIEFVQGINSNGSFFEKEQRIEVNQKLSRASKDAVKTLENLDKLLTCLHHEFSHYEDHLEDNSSKSGRFYVGGRWGSILRILEGLGFSANSPAYDAAKTFYEVSRSEVFARYKSFIETLKFLENVEKCAYETLASLDMKEIISKKCYEAGFEKCLKQPLAEEDYQILHGLEVIRILKTSIQFKIQKETEFLRYYRLKKTYLLPDLKMLFEEAADKFFESDSKGKKSRAYNEQDLLNVLEIPDFYDEKIAKKLYEFAKSKNNIEILGCLAKISGFPMPEEEKLKYMKIDIKNKNPIEKFDVMRGLEAYKKRKLKQKDMEK